MMGVRSYWECPSCGDTISKSEVLIETPTKIYFTSPKKCGCGNVTNFILMNFKPMQVGLADNDEEELLAVPNNLQEELKGFMIDKIKEKQEENKNENR